MEAEAWNGGGRGRGKRLPFFLPNPFSAVLLAGEEISLGELRRKCVWGEQPSLWPSHLMCHTQSGWRYKIGLRGGSSPSPPTPFSAGLLAKQGEQPSDHLISWLGWGNKAPTTDFPAAGSQSGDPAMPSAWLAGQLGRELGGGGNGPPTWL